MKGKKMRRVLLFTLCFVLVIAITSALNPADEADLTEEEGNPRPIRASSSTSSSGTTRKRNRARRNHKHGSRNGVQKRRLQSSFRPTRAPLFEASPPDPFIDNGAAEEHTLQYGHSHSPPTRDPYYSPSKVERERKRKRIKLNHGSLEPVIQNSFDQESDGESPEFQRPEKNYAFAYAVGDEAEDFSHKHKQTKDGPITIGEYRITLPDGRTQVVRYTAGGTHGYKADVTYEAPNGLQQGQHQVSSGGHRQRQHEHQHQLQHQVQHQPQVKQYHASVQPTYHLSATPVPTLNSNRIYKSRPLKNTALHHNGDVEYSPQSSNDDDEELEYHHPTPQPTPRIRIKTGGRIPHPSPTAADLLNGVSSTPTPRPNSIYDKISPYRNGGKYSGSDELAYAHENSPRAGPARSKSKKISKQIVATQPTYYDSPHASPSPQPVRKVNHSPTKKYKDPTAGYYVNGAAAHPQPQTHQSHQLNDQFIRPLKNFQYLQETPIRHHSDSGVLIAKPVKEPAQHVVNLNHHFRAIEPSLAPQISFTPQPVVSRKPKKLKKIKHGIHTPVGQYLIQSPVTAQTPIYQQHNHVSSYQTSGPFHYYNSFHEPHHHHGFGQLSASPTPVTSVRHSESPLPNAYPVTAFPTGGSFLHDHQPRIRIPTPPSHSGHLEYLDSPASGDRPNRQKIKEALSRLPVDDLPTPRTTIHPYEVGSADYGKSVAYGNGKDHEKGFPGTGYSPFTTGDPHSFDNFDPTNSLYNSLSSPTGGSLTGGGTGGGTGQGYFPGDISDQFNFLDGFHNFDIEQANVREIRQNRPTRGSRSRGTRNNKNGESNSRRVPRRPDKRQGVPAQSSEEEVTQPPTTPSPRRRQRQTTTKPPSQPQTTQPTATRNRGRRRRTRTQQPDPMMHAVESKRTGPTSPSRSTNDNHRN